MDETLYAHVRALQRGGARAVRASKALSNLLFESDDNVALIVAAGAIAPLVALVRNGSDGGKEQAACALANLADNGGDVAAQPIVDAGGIAALVELLRDGSDDGKEQAARGLGNLSSADNAYDAMIAEAGAIDPLLELERNGPEQASEEAMHALGYLAHNDDLTRPILAARRRRVAPAVDPTIAAMANLAACIVCLDAARSVVFFPCAHACFCTSCQCAASHRATSAHCPICRTAITGFVPVRLA